MHDDIIILFFLMIQQNRIYHKWDDWPNRGILRGDNLTWPSASRTQQVKRYSSLECVFDLNTNTYIGM